MQFSLLNLLALFTFAAWLMAVCQADTISRGFCIFGMAATTLVVSMVLALCSPIGDGQLDVKRNSILVVFFAFTKLVILFACAVFLVFIVTQILGDWTVERWLH